MKLIKNAALAAPAGRRPAGAPGAGAGSRRSARTSPSALPQLGKIDEVSKTPMPGLFEVRVGTDLFYTDAEGNFLLQGNLIDTKAQRNLTEERAGQAAGDRLRRAAGQGRLHDRARQRQAQAGGVRRPELRLLQAVRARPAEGRQRHRLPVPLPDPRARTRSTSRATSGAPRTRARPGRTGWCASRPSPAATCDTAALARNVEFGKKYKITGTPTLVFADGTRVPGAIGAPQVEKQLAAAKQ